MRNDFCNKSKIRCTIFWWNLGSPFPVVNKRINQLITQIPRILMVSLSYLPEYIFFYSWVEWMHNWVFNELKCQIQPFFLASRLGCFSSWQRSLDGSFVFLPSKPLNPRHIQGQDQNSQADHRRRGRLPHLLGSLRLYPTLRVFF